MEKISRINQLRKEQKMLRERQLHLEKSLRQDWKIIYTSLQPKGLAREAFWSLVTGIGTKLFFKSEKGDANHYHQK
jgi:hypothetical protein